MRLVINILINIIILLIDVINNISCDLCNIYSTRFLVKNNSFQEKII